MADADQSNRWNWYEASGVSSLSEGMLVDPDGIFGGLPWTLFTDLGVTFQSLAFTIEGDDSLSLEDYKTTRVSVKPNPVNDFVSIEIDSSNQLNNLKLYNVVGQLVHEGTKLQFDISDLNSGIYLLKLNTKYGQVTKRIVKK